MAEVFRTGAPPNGPSRAEPCPVGHPQLACPAVTQALRFLMVLEALGLAGLPLAARALGRLPGAGLGLAHVVGLLLLGWLVWFAGSLGIPTGLGLVIVMALVLVAGAVA